MQHVRNTAMGSIIAKRIGWTTQAVLDFSGSRDRWFTADEAKAIVLVDEVH